MSMQAINFAMTLPVDEPGPRLLLFIIAHHIHWQTGVMRVSQKDLAAEARVSERSVRRFVQTLEDDGFITRSKTRSDDGRQGYDEISLIGYLEWQDVLYNGGTIQPPATRGKPRKEQADNLSGSGNPGGQTDGVQADKNGGPAGHCCPPSKGPLEPSVEPFAPLPPSPAEPQRSGQMNFKNSGRAGPIITIRAGHNGWDAWLEHIENRLGVRQREAAEAFGELDVTTRWPRDETPMPIIGRSA